MYPHNAHRKDQVQAVLAEAVSKLAVGVMCIGRGGFLSPSQDEEQAGCSCTRGQGGADTYGGKGKTGPAINDVANQSTSESRYQYASMPYHSDEDFLCEALDDLI